MPQFSVLRQGGRGRTVRHTLSALAVAFSAACAGESLTPPDKPIIPVDPPVSPAVAGAAWRFDVSTSKRTIKITAPRVAVSGAPGQFSAGGIDYSLVGADVITLSASNYSASGVGTGGAPAGKVLVKFDVAITNLLTSVDLITPTFPVPPGAGVFAFPFSTNVTTTSGGVNTSGNDIIIDLPNTGGVATSTDFDGAPYNWFNDTGCPASTAPTDCYRYETYAVPVAAGGTTAAQTIGFVIDPTVSNFSAKIIVAADLQNSGPAISRTVQGTVSTSTPNVGNLSGGLVSISGAGSNAPVSGAYSIAGVGAGPHTVSYAPPAGSGCSVPASVPITVTSGSPAPIVVDFLVTGCTVVAGPTGQVNGAINFAATTGSSPSLAGVVVTLNPDATLPLPGPASVNTSPSAAGAYGAAVEIGTGAGAGSGVITFANLPASCTFVGASTSSYTGANTSTAVTAAPVTITCPAVLYPLVYAWGAPSGGSIVLTATIDMSAQNSLLNNGAGADNIEAYQATLTWGTRVSAPVCAAGSSLTGPLTPVGSSMTPVLTSTGGATGLVTLFTCTFTYTVGGTGTFTVPFASHVLIGGAGSDSFEARTAVTVNPIP